MYFNKNLILKLNIRFGHSIIVYNNIYKQLGGFQLTEKFFRLVNFKYTQVGIVT